MFSTDEIEKAINSGTTDEAITLCKTALATPEAVDNDTLWFLYGKALWKAGQHSQSTAAFNRALEINPASPAALALELNQEVASFFNPDLLNP